MIEIYININIGTDRLGDIKPCDKDLQCQPLLFVVKLLFDAYQKITEGNTRLDFDKFYSTQKGKRMVNRLTDTIWKEAPVHILHNIPNFSNLYNIENGEGGE